MSFELLLCHVLVRLDWCAKTKGIVDVEREVVFFSHLFGALDAFCDLVVDPGFRLGGRFGVRLPRSTRQGGRACLRIDYVVTTRAYFGTGVVPWLVAENTLEHAVTFARDTVSAWAFVVMLLHCMIAGTLRTADLSFRNRAFPREVFHRVAA